ncbi:MAG: bifunctional phosphoribosylaminoimidazolecarboxamide formyltransferase/IMP cyclohydrolase [Ginsengibacter sp.]
MQKKIKSALISVYNKEGLQPIITLLQKHDITIYSTGGTQKFVEDNGGKCIAVESLTGYPSILGGRVKTLHPVVFGGFLGRRDVENDLKEMEQYHIPEIDLVMVDLYPFEDTVKATSDEATIIEKIDIGGPSMIRAAAKNFKSVVIVGDKNDYAELENILADKNAETSLDERKNFARKAFDVCSRYDIAISNYFNKTQFANPFSTEKKALRYGENPHQQGFFTGDLNEVFEQLHGKELSYNNLVDVDAAVSLMSEFNDDTTSKCTFAIIKHTNVCGVAKRENVSEAFSSALAGDPESAFGGVLISNKTVDKNTAEFLKDLFFEVLIAPSFDEDALAILFSKKNRIILKMKEFKPLSQQSRSLLNGLLIQDNDEVNFKEWSDVGGRKCTSAEKDDLEFANLICKHLKSNAIAIIKDKQLLGKGCGQTSRIDALRQAIAKANQFEFNLENAVVASDAFFPFDDCVKIAHEVGISAFVQPGGSIRDKDSIEYCKQNNLAMVMTGLRHFKH